MSGVHKLKESDEICRHIETTNDVELLFFTDQHQVYKSRACDFDDTKASLLGDYIPAKLGFDEGEKLVHMVVTKDFSGSLLFFFENGKAAKVPLESYATKTRRKKLSNAYCDKYPLAAVWDCTEDREYVITSSAQRKLLFDSSMIPLKTTRTTQGVQVMTLKKNQFVTSVQPYEENSFANPQRYRAKSLPAAGAILRQEDLGEQLKL